MMLLKCCTQSVSKLGKLSNGRRTGKGQFFIPIPKKDNAKEYSNYRTIVLIFHASKIMLKILQASLHQYVNWDLPDAQLDLEKTEEPEIKLSTFVGSYRKQENPRKASTSASSTMWKHLTVCITTNWKILQEMGVPDHLTCLLWKLYMGQDSIARTVHGTMDWFKIGKGVHQGCILSVYFICRVHHVKCWAGWLTSWNQDCREKYQQPQICGWYHHNGKKWRNYRASWWQWKRRVKKLA